MSKKEKIKRNTESLRTGLDSPYAAERASAIDYLIAEYLTTPEAPPIPIQELHIGWSKDDESKHILRTNEYVRAFARVVKGIKSKRKWDNLYNLLTAGVGVSRQVDVPIDVMMQSLAQIPEEYRPQWVDFIKNCPELPDERTFWVLLPSYISPENNNLSQCIVDIMVARKKYVVDFPWSWRSLYLAQIKYAFDRFPQEMRELLEYLSELDDEDSVDEPLAILSQLIEDNETFLSYELLMKSFFFRLAASEHREMIRKFLDFSRPYASREFLFFCLQTYHQNRSFSESELFDYASVIVDIAKKIPALEADVFKMFQDISQNIRKDGDSLRLMFIYFRSLIAFAKSRNDHEAMRKYLDFCKENFPPDINEMMFFGVLNSLEPDFKKDIHDLIALHIEKCPLGIGTQQVINFVETRMEYFDTFIKAFIKKYQDNEAYRLLGLIVNKKAVYPNFQEAILENSYFFSEQA